MKMQSQYNRSSLPSMSLRGLSPPRSSLPGLSLRTASPRSSLRSVSPRSSLRNLSPRSSLRSLSPPRSSLRSMSPRSSLRSMSPRGSLRSLSPRGSLRSLSPRGSLRSLSPRSSLRSMSPRSSLRGLSPIMDSDLETSCREPKISRQYPIEPRKQERIFNIIENLEEKGEKFYDVYTKARAPAIAPPKQMNLSFDILPVGAAPSFGPSGFTFSLPPLPTVAVDEEEVVNIKRPSTVRLHLSNMNCGHISSKQKLHDLVMENTVNEPIYISYDSDILNGKKTYWINRNGTMYEVVLIDDEIKSVAVTQREAFDVDNE